MAGLLDFGDPGVQMGLGLMALGQAPRAQAAQGLMGLFNSMDQAEQRKADAAYRNAQIAELQRKGQAAQRQQDMIAGLFGVGQPQAAASGAQTAGPAGFNNATLNQIAALKAMGGPDLLEAYKLNQSGVKMDAGNYYMKDGQAVYLPKAADGMVVDPRTGQARALPGYADANASIEAAKTAAVEGAKYPYAVGLEQAKANIGSANDLVTLNLPSGPLQVTRAQALAMTQPQPQGPQIGGGQNLTPQLRELIAQDAAANGIQNPTTNFQGAGRGQAYGVTNAPARGFGIPLQPKSAEEFSNNVAKADAEQLNAWRTAAENANSALSTVENLRDAVNKGVYSGGGAQAKTAAASIINGLTGAKPKGFVGSELFNANASALVLDRIKSLGGNPSNADRDFIERTIPNLDKSAEARDALINFMEQKARGSIDLYKRADAHARQNNGLAGFDQFAKPQKAAGADNTPPDIANLLNKYGGR